LRTVGTGDDANALTLVLPAKDKSGLLADYLQVIRSFLNVNITLKLVNIERVFLSKKNFTRHFVLLKLNLLFCLRAGRGNEWSMDLDMGGWAECRW
jgi:hypothetical protein